DSPLVASALATGSPPHAWGQPGACRAGTPSPRFTPTRVGTTAAVVPLPSSVPVHPHTRGDNPGAADRKRTLAGSPPHAWGQRHIPDTTQPGARFTPTRVGTTTSTTPWPAAPTVH